ncbi:MAG: GTP-binding protein [Methanomassiliicoccales archaeon]|jgi:G3E family GTPase
MQRTRFIILGGYLGAGKTTLALSMAKLLKEKHGKSVAVITNDQGNALVDTAYMKGSGVDVREVLGGCFCSHFDEFIKSARSLVSMGRPDIIIAEPIGTSTNILASVVVPLREMYPNEFEVAPLFIVVDSTKAMETLAQRASFGLGGGRIIPSHQVREAEVVLLTKIDKVDEGILEMAKGIVLREVPDATVLAVSAKAGTGLSAVVDLVLSERTSSKAALGIDNKLFATEKATMGWYSGTAELETKGKVDLYDLSMRVMRVVGDTYGGDRIGHVKLVMESSTASLKMSLVGDAAQIDGIKGGRYAQGCCSVVLNARVMAPPAEIRKVMEKALRESMGEDGASIVSYADSAIKPVPESPDHFRSGQ